MLPELSINIHYKVCFFKLIFILCYSWFTVLCLFQVYNNMIHYTYVCIHYFLDSFPT